MRLHVFVYASRNRTSQTVKTDLELLGAAAKRLGHELEVIYSKECQLQFFKKPQILVQNKKVKNIQALLVRANFLHEQLEQQASLIRQFEMSGIPVVNTYEGVIHAKNKILTLQTLSAQKIPIPKTYIMRSVEHIEDVVKEIGNYPVILKTMSGSHGAGVSIVESQRGLRSIVHMLTEGDFASPVIVQEYIKESSGKDIRVFIVGKRILGAMERIAAKRGEFRSNFKLGGRIRVAALSAKEKRIAFAAVRACGLDMAGVDILRTKNGPKVLEVNCNPGLEGITQATGRDIAGEIIKYTYQKAIQSNKKNSL